ncbi:DUF6355 family natural product biosynthesis protein [Amycolatopsis rifamycinica]|uniref:Secreted protein n=1 Tax=Amycolatopsis rifamycinica TaxID=287986 RepID=A0A066U900_9PSEU|nr:DUF6355 family natural product biosynthesis protein [Amycolatopsis rifamycinica]KDN23575.1 hypothetical protein DV20_03555 [Amycolatopsis rifamycinica]
MLKTIAAKIGAATAVTATAGALLLGASAPASATEQGSAGAAAVCGYYEQGLLSYYNHCGTTHVQIQVTYIIGSDEFKCVDQGITNLGYNATNAWYTGNLC